MDFLLFRKLAIFLKIATIFSSHFTKGSPLLLSGNECGRITLRNSKILAGEDTHSQEFPWMVSFKNTEGHFCGGFVIDSRHIISAAHCFFRKYNSNLRYTDDGIALPGSISVVVGQHDLTILDNINATIENISLHPNFEDGGVLNNDIAVLRTTEEMIWGQSLLPICLPTRAELINGEMVTVAGWGNTYCHNSRVRPSKTLKKVTIPVWKEAECRKAYQDANYEFSREYYICAGDEERDSSKGDSGSPLMAVDKTGSRWTWTAIGIVSAGRFMCEDRVPGVYTQISRYVEWIESQTVLR